MRKLEKRIFVDSQSKKKLAQEMKCSEQFVRSALLYRQNTLSLKGKMIRHKALNEYNGVKIGE